MIRKSFSHRTSSVKSFLQEKNYEYNAMPRNQSGSKSNQSF